MNGVKGYKVFNPDWTCRGFQYEVGKIFEEDVTPCTCERGFHFCERASDCFQYYSFNPENKVAEVIALGEIDSEGTKSCTNKIQIVREIPRDELLRIVNEGKDCTGLCNTGNWNTGDRNTGDCNTGDCNTGLCNTGDRNTGNWNTGNCNTGDWNTGDWNKSSYNNGCFMTDEPKIMMFNKATDWTYRDWINSDARYLLNQIAKNTTKWVCSCDMKDEEKVAHPEYETAGGYLKILGELECGQIWWNGLREGDRQIIRSLPNFDPDIFEKCTGIKVNG